MKVVETKIYLKFISWFILVSLLPLAILFILIYIFSPQVNLLEDQEVVRAVLIAVFASLAFVFILSLIATRRLSRLITEPIQEAVLDLSKVVENLSKSIENLSDISENNSEISEFLISSSKQQQLGLKSGSVAVAGMVKSLNQIVGKTQSSAKHASDIDKLASQSESKSKLALDSLVSVKNLVTENQKLSQALDAYTKKVKNIAERVAVLADTAKFLSLNASIRANQSSSGDSFAGIVSQIRELNATSEQAAASIQSLVGDMQRQIEQVKESSQSEWEETNKSIKVVSQTIKFLSKIAGGIGIISQSINDINKSTEKTHQESDNIKTMIGNLNKESKSLVKQTDDIAQIIFKQLVVNKSLNKSSTSLNRATSTLNNLVGKQ
ncbi:methyl-accepting chemotaxis protein [Candidatus Parcubacteria bacterium]|nr:methyl-accepting chemotaxis protein [Candidatus Parcubacteria bacterium]MBT7228755.1 methyl-accepting chemotaxis protein [Candidatus Parcubacteria bacterium]